MRSYPHRAVASSRDGTNRWTMPATATSVDSRRARVRYEGITRGWGGSDVYCRASLPTGRGRRGERICPHRSYTRSVTDELIETARAALEAAYVPYSDYTVGAALRTADGTVFT